MSDPTKNSASGKAAWKALDAATTVAAAALSPGLIALLWRTATGKQPPKNARDLEVSNREAIMWAAVGGALAQVIRVAARRQVAQYWFKSTGKTPPGR